MKKTIIISSALIVMTAACYAQTNKEPDYMTAQEFSIDFPNATNVHWSRKDFERASFMLDGKKLSAFYDFHNKLIGTVSDASYDVLPEAAKRHIARYYPGYTPQAVILFDDNENNSSDMVLYDTRFNNDDNYFVEMKKGDKNIVLMVSLPGEVSYFTNMNGRIK